MAVIDVHQHLWPEALVAALSKRNAPPRLRGATLELAGEPACEVDLAVHSLDARIALLDRDGIDRAILSFPPTFGAAELPGDERRELVAAYETGILELVSASGGRLAALAAGDRADGFVGLCVGAPEVRDLESLAPRLDALGRAGGFLFVHPGLAHPPAGAPPWWAAIVDYTAQMQAAYAAWLAEGAERWADLPVVFAILAGGGPFQFERLVSRAMSGRELLHPNVLFETSSYGRRAIEFCLSTFGVDNLVFGSDAPVIEVEQTLSAVRGFGDAVANALCNVNPGRLLP